jgi:hypothetical protein
MDQHLFRELTFNFVLLYDHLIVPDKIAKRRRVFKVETVSTRSYVKVQFELYFLQLSYIFCEIFVQL